MRAKKSPGKEIKDVSDPRQANFALQAADRIRQMGNSPFSLLPSDELIRQANDWYHGCSEGTLRGNFAAIDTWARAQAASAAQQGFTLEDVLELFRTFRKCAIEIEHWNEDVLSSVDAVINEAIASLRGNVTWTIPVGTDYLVAAKKDSKPIDSEVILEVDSDDEPGERRDAARCHIRLPIRVKSKNTPKQEQEFTTTKNVSRTGLRFNSGLPYKNGHELRVVYPYWAAQESFNKEYTARVIRVDSLPDGTADVSIKFTEPLGRKSGSRKLQ